MISPAEVEDSLWETDRLPHLKEQRKPIKVRKQSRSYLTAGNPRTRVSELEGWNLKNIPELLDFRKSEVKGGIRVQGTGLRRRREQKQRSWQTGI